jgi:flagellar motor switch protein FliN
MMGDPQEPKRAMSKDEIDNLFDGDDAQDMLKAESGPAGDDAAADQIGGSGGAGDAVGEEAFDGSAARDLDSAEEAPAVQSVEFGQLESPASTGERANIDLLMDVKLPVAVELGRTNVQVKEILDFSPGSIVELGRMASEPVDILVNGVLVARGEVVVIEEHFGVRLISLISPRERIRSLAGDA